MPSKRTPLSRPRKPLISEEMLELFERGLVILKAGDHERWEGAGGRRREYLDLDKKLNWMLLGQPSHAISVFNPVLDQKQPPTYMRRLMSGGADWHNSQRWRRALLQGLERQRQTVAAIAATGIIPRNL